MSEFSLDIKKNYECLRLSILGGLVEGLTQEEIGSIFGMSKHALHYHIRRFEIDWLSYRKFFSDHLLNGKIKELSKDEIVKSESEIRKEAIANLSDEQVFELFDSRITRFSNEIKESIFNQLREEFIHEDNELLAQDIRAEIDKIEARPELKMILKQAVNSYTAKPDSKWLTPITNILKDIDAEKYKRSGLQENGDVVFKYRMKKKVKEYFDQEGITFENFMRHCVKQLPI